MAWQFGQDYMKAQEQQYITRAQDSLNSADVFARNTVGQANADAANLIRGGQNQFLAAQATLANTQRSAANQSKLQAFGDQSNALAENEVRVMDSMVRGRLSARLQAAATLGALRADASARGVGGSSADALRSVVSLQAGAVETQAQDNQRYISFDSLMRRQGLVRASVSSLDFGQSIPTLDYGINVAPKAQVPLLAGNFGPGPFQQALGGVIGTGLTLWAKGAFKSPSASPGGGITAASGVGIGDALSDGSGLSYQGGYFSGA
ncbi:virion core protein, T7 gp14 family [Bordetella genomosp. 9]|nr:hypothetical protein [Bordetella genomosp. 9]